MGVSGASSWLLSEKNMGEKKYEKIWRI